MKRFMVSKSFRQMPSALARFWSIAMMLALLMAAAAYLYGSCNSILNQMHHAITNNEKFQFEFKKSSDVERKSVQEPHPLLASEEKALPEEIEFKRFDGNCNCTDRPISVVTNVYLRF